MSLTEFLRTVVRVLDDAGVPYMLTGSFASAYYAVPRATQDLDVVIVAGEAEVDRIVDAMLEQGWYVDRNAAHEARQTLGQFNAIDPSSGWKVDLIVRKDRPYSRVDFDRRQRVTLLGVDVWIASLEDLLIADVQPPRGVASENGACNGTNRRDEPRDPRRRDAGAGPG